MEKAELQYFDAAASAGVYVASAVGFDSVPADMGVMYALSKFSPPSVPAYVESFLTIIPGPNGFGGTIAFCYYLAVNLYHWPTYFEGAPSASFASTYLAKSSVRTLVYRLLCHETQATELCLRYTMQT